MLLSYTVIGTIIFAMLLAAKHPLFLVAIFLFARPLIQPIADMHLYLHGVIPLTALVPVAFVIIAIIHCVFKNNYPLLRGRMVFFYIILFLAFPSVYNTPQLSDSFSFIIKFITALFMYNLVYGAIRSDKEITFLLWILIVQCLILNVVGFHQYFSGTERISSCLGQYNAYGEYLCMLFGIAFMLLLKTKKKWPMVFLLFTITFILISMVLAKNRGSWIAMTIALLLSTAFYYRRINPLYIIIPFIIFSIIASDALMQRFGELNDVSDASGLSKNTFQGRIAFWGKLITLVPKSPIFGHGIGASRSIAVKYFKWGQVPHNDYIRIMVESGVPAFLVYIIFLVSILISNIRRKWVCRQWWVHFPLLYIICYWGVISLAQNIIDSMSIFPIFLALVAIGDKFALIEHLEKKNQ